MTLRSSLIMWITGVLLLTLLLGSVLTYLKARSKVETEMEAAIAVGGRIALNAVDDVDEVTSARRSLALLVADFDGNRHLRARVEGGSSGSGSTSKLADSSEPAPDWFYWLLKGEPRAVRVPLPPAFDSLGQFILETDSHNEVSEVWGEVMNMLTIMAVFCSIVLVLVYAVLGRALRPLEDLSRAFTEIGSPGRFPHVVESGPIELVRVYQGFNQMTGRLAETEQKNRQLREQLMTVQEEERSDIARDLHDEIGPFLFAVDVDAASVEQLAGSGCQGDVISRVRAIRESVGHMQKHVKDILARLRPAALTDLGIAHAVASLVSFWQGRHPGIRFNVDVPAERFGEPVDGAIYRIVQESLSNAIRHGDPKTIDIRVAAVERDVIRVSVRDDGRGMSASGMRSGFGIRGMQERVRMLGGTLEAGNDDTRGGFVVSAELPPALPPACEPGSGASREVASPQ